MSFPSSVGHIPSRSIQHSMQFLPVDLPLAGLAGCAGGGCGGAPWLTGTALGGALWDAGPLPFEGDPRSAGGAPLCAWAGVLSLGGDLGSFCLGGRCCPLPCVSRPFPCSLGPGLPCPGCSPGPPRGGGLDSGPPLGGRRESVPCAESWPPDWR